VVVEEELKMNVGSDYEVLEHLLAITMQTSASKSHFVAYASHTPDGGDHTTYKSYEYTTKP